MQTPYYHLLGYLINYNICAFANTKQGPTLPVVACKMIHTSIPSKIPQQIIENS